MTHGDRAVSMWMVCRRCEGDMYLAPGVLQRRQATVLPLRLLRGEFKRPRVRLGGGPDGCQAFPVTVLVYYQNCLGFGFPHCQRSRCLVPYHTVKSAGGSLHPISVTDTLTHPVAPLDASFSFTPPPIIAKVPHNSLSH